MSQKYLIRIAELESQLRQKDQQLSLVEETEAFLRSALARAEEKIEEDEREIESGKPAPSERPATESG
ncbi:protein encoded within IS [Escherichia coli]|nr:protein encoded within IS [Escherichia coli]